MPAQKLSAVLIGQHYADRYAAILTKLDEWEQAKATFLVEVGKECLALIRKVLEPLPEHDVTGRKSARAQTVKEIEDQLPEVEGIGAPQVNRWIRWAGAGEVMVREGFFVSSPTEFLKTSSAGPLSTVPRLLATRTV